MTALPAPAATGAPLDVAHRLLPASSSARSADLCVVDAHIGPRTVVIVADVCGHGPDAARLAAAVEPTIRALAAVEPQPAALLERLNVAVAPHATDRGFVLTALAASFDPDRRRVTWASAGHLPPHWLGSGEPAQGTVPGVPIGARDQVGCVPRAARLDGNEGLLLYTDGLQDARSPDGVRFGARGVTRALAALGPAPAQATLDGLAAAFAEHTAGRFDDDVCMVAVRMP